MIVDLHAHILPGLDDGPATADECLAAVAAAADAGVGILAATPHVRNDYPTTPSAMETGVHDLVERIGLAGISITIVTGAEVAVDVAATLSDGDLARFALGGSDGVLVEFPYEGWPLGLAKDLDELRARGFRLVLAHPERNPEVQAAPGRLSALVETGILVQLTASSVAGTGGPRAQATALRLLELELAHMLASDMHGAFRGSSDFHAAFARLRNPRLARWLTHDVPAAVIADDDVPVRPPTAARRRFGWLR